VDQEGILLQALCESCQIAAVDIHLRPVVISYPGVNERVDEFAALRTDGVQTEQVSRWLPNAAGEQEADARDSSNLTASQKLKDRFSQSAKFAPAVRHTKAFSKPW
tara:strand:- start:82 stop:399 length:318 start_codon:yes stop_codon:yes gene_type:complete